MPARHLLIVIGWAGLWAGCLVTTALADGPYTPASDQDVVEVLPRALIEGHQQLRSLRQKLQRSPGDPTVAVRLAAAYIEIGDAEKDPRYYGYAQAVLGPWWEAERPDSELLRLRAKLKEKAHQYGEAADDLRRLLVAHPQDIQAWVELSNLHRVRGEYTEAQQACDRLGEFAGSLSVMICQAPLWAVTGRAEEAYVSLQQIPSSAAAQLGSAYRWTLLMRAELACILGLDDVAEEHFRAGLAINSVNNSLLRAYADYLLDHDRAAEVLQLTRDHLNDNGLLLRATIAARRIGDDQSADPWQAQLARRFAEIRLRGDVPHGRFESRSALALEHDPQKALTLAIANWNRQKEYRDTRNLLEAALAAGDPTAARPVIRFLRQHQTEDVRLASLVQELEALP